MEGLASGLLGALAGNLEQGAQVDTPVLRRVLRVRRARARADLAGRPDARADAVADAQPDARLGAAVVLRGVARLTPLVVSGSAEGAHGREPNAPCE